MRPFGKNAGDLRQSKTDDNDFAIVQFSRSGSRHHFTGQNFGHRFLLDCYS
jgi:hypothetical protein